jgi:uncharacterized protein with NRDE domain
MDALRAGTTDAALDVLRAVDAREYNAFNVLFGDARALYVAYARDHEAKVAIEKLERGIWVLNNDAIGSQDFPKASRATDLASAVKDLPWRELSTRLPAILGDHELPPIDRIREPAPGAPLTREQLRTLQAICVHTPVYGTRSASIVAIDEGSTRSFLFADGPPCVTPFVDATSAFASAG